MKLPAEVWRTIAGHIPRGYLDGWVTENRALANRIRATYEPNPEGPLRRVFLEVFQPHGMDSLCVFMTTCNPALQCYPLEAFRAKRVHCGNAVELSNAIRDSYVQYISFHYVDNVVRVQLEPHARRWLNEGNLYGNPRDFPDAQLFERFYDELAVTSGMVALELPRTMQFDFEPARFWHFEAIRRCQWLRVVRMPEGPQWTLTSELIIEWLSTAIDAPEKRLQVQDSVMSMTTAQLIGDLIAQFVSDTGPAKPYTVKILTRSVNGQCGERINDATGELLQVWADARSVTLKRSIKP